jgi:hypothetical protein
MSDASDKAALLSLAAYWVRIAKEAERTAKEEKIG